MVTVLNTRLPFFVILLLTSTVGFCSNKPIRFKLEGIEKFNVHKTTTLYFVGSVKNQLRLFSSVQVSTFHIHYHKGELWRN